MRKLLILSAIALLLVPTILSIDLDIENVGSNEVMLGDAGLPAVFNFEITNNNGQDSIRFLNTVGFSMSPENTVSFSPGETKTVQMKIYPRSEFGYRGFYTFDIFARSTKDSSETSKEVTVKIINLEDAFDVGSGEVHPDSNSIEIYIKNLVNYNFENLSVRFKSAFFDFEENISLSPLEKQTVNVELNKDDFKKLQAAFYTLIAEISANSETAEVDGVIKYAEQSSIKATKKEYGLIISTQIVEKTNEGNVVSGSETIIRKNIFSRLFTSFSPEPDIVERDGFDIYYTWTRSINPGETLKIIAKTNWLLPFFLVFSVLAVVIFARQYSKTHLVMRKKVSFVNAKGGEFALKISILVNARSHLERVTVIDKLPHLVKIYERFGGEKPSRVNEKNRRIEWELGEMEAGETRYISYVIYSKVGVMGKFALPTATAVYDKDGEIHETESNKAFFVAEQKSGKGENI